MQYPKHYRYIFSVFLLLIFSVKAFALTYPHRDIADIADDANTVIEGTVSLIETGIDNGELHTFITFNDLIIHRGLIESDEYILKVPGGSYRGVVRKTGMVPNVDEGDRLILFLQSEHDNTPIVGGTAGVFRVATEQDPKPYMVTPDGDPVDTNAMPIKESYEDEGAFAMVDDKGKHTVLKRTDEENNDLSARLYYADLVAKISHHDYKKASGKATSAIKPDSLTRRYANIRNLKTKKDWQAELLDNTSDEDFQNKLARLIEWQGLPKSATASLMKTVNPKAKASRLSALDEVDEMIKKDRSKEKVKQRLESLRKNGKIVADGISTPAKMNSDQGAVQ